MKSFNKTLIYLFLFLLFGSSTSETDTFKWTRFRGTNGQGIDSHGNTPVVWDSTDYQWRIALPGSGNASPVVWENKIFVTCADDEKDIGYLMAVDERDGKILWQKEFIVTDLSLHNNNKLDAATPAVDGTQVYAIWYSKEKTELIALDHSGNIQWKTEFGGIESRHGGGSSLMLTDKYVVFTREQEEGSSVSSSWVAVDKRTGSGISCLFRGTDYHGRKGKTFVIELDPNTNQGADSARYSLPPNLSPYVPTPIVVGELLFLFMDSGTVACLRLATGELMWKERPAGDIFGSPVCVGGNLYCMTKAGNVLVIHAGSTYQLYAIYELGEGSFSTPVMSGTGMVFRTFTQLMLLGNDS